MSDRTNIFDVEEREELNEELGIDYHAMSLGNPTENPTFGFGGSVTGSTEGGASAKAWTDTPKKKKRKKKKRRRTVTKKRKTTRAKKRAAPVLRSVPGVSIREQVDLIDVSAPRTSASAAWQRLAAQGLGRHGCPMAHVDPFTAELNRIKSALALAQVQREATSEHNKLRAIDAYRARVLLRLRALLARRCD